MSKEQILNSMDNMGKPLLNLYSMQLGYIRRI